MLRWEQNSAELRCFFSVFCSNFIIIFVAVICCIGGAVVKCVANFLSLRKLCVVLRTVQGFQNHLCMLEHACSDVGITSAPRGWTFQSQRWCQGQRRRKAAKLSL